MRTTISSRGNRPDAEHPGRRTPSRIPRLVLFAALLLAGCAYKRAAQQRAAVAVEKNAGALQEESRALTTAALDAVSLAPTNPPTSLAKRFLQRDQEIVGMPAQRIDVEALLAEKDSAWKELNARMDEQRRLLQQRGELETRLRQAESELVELGRKYEAERNRSVVRRIWGWAVGTLGLGGIIAVCVLCPAVLPLLGNLLGWLIGKIPALAGFLGLVGRRAFDGVVKGVGEIRRELKQNKALPPEQQPSYRPAEVLDLVDNTLRGATEGEANHRGLIEARREALKV
jgi:hypothetical protein